MCVCVCCQEKNTKLAHVETFKNKLARSDLATHTTLPYSLTPLLYLILNKIIYNHVGRLLFAFLDYWVCTDYVYKIWLSLVQGSRISPSPHFGRLVVAFLVFWGPLIMYTKFGWVWYKSLEFHPHFWRLVFALLVFWGPTDYVYKIWLSLVQGPRFSFSQYTKTTCEIRFWYSH